MSVGYFFKYYAYKNILRPNSSRSCFSINCLWFAFKGLQSSLRVTRAPRLERYTYYYATRSRVAWFTEQKPIQWSKCCQVCPYYGILCLQLQTTYSIHGEFSCLSSDWRWMVIWKIHWYFGFKNTRTFLSWSPVALRFYHEFSDETGRCVCDHISQVRWV